MKNCKWLNDATGGCLGAVFGLLFGGIFPLSVMLIAALFNQDGGSPVAFFAFILLSIFFFGVIGSIVGVAVGANCQRRRREAEHNRLMAELDAAVEREKDQ